MMDVKELVLLIISSALVSNVVLSQFLGLCPFLGVSKKVETAAGMGGAVIFVITLASAVTGVIYKFVLEKFNITYLQTIVFILVIAALVQFVEMFLKKYMQGLYQALGVYLPLITTNCVVLFVAQQVAAYTVTKSGVVFDYNFGTMLIYALATALGFMLVITLFSFIRVRIDSQDSTPKPFKGNAIALITTALMVLAFSAFVGLV